MEGKFVRAAYNNEGYVIIGYQPADRLIGEDWLLIDVGITVREGVKNYTMKREALSLETPDGKTHPLPSIEEQRKGNTQALQNRERVQRDSINYFPPSASRACAMTFFPDLTSRAMPQDDVELSQTRACLGRLFFHVPGGIQVRPTLAQREVRGVAHSRPVPHPDQGRREVLLEELQEHRKTGRGSVQAEEEVRAQDVTRLGLTAVVALASFVSLTGAPAPKFSYYLTGNAGNVAATTEAGLGLMGGGTDVDALFTWMSARAGGGEST